MSRFDDCPNVRSVLAALLGADPTWDVTDQQHVLIDAAADRIGRILFGVPGYKGSGLCTPRIASHHP